MCKQSLRQFSLNKYEYMPRDMWSFCVMRKWVFFLFLFQKPENGFLNTGEGREQKKVRGSFQFLYSFFWNWPSVFKCKSHAKLLSRHVPWGIWWEKGGCTKNASASSKRNYIIPEHFSTQFILFKYAPRMCLRTMRSFFRHPPPGLQGCQLGRVFGHMVPQDPRCAISTMLE